MRELDAGSVDAIVTDPPYGLGFMGREWDSLPPGLPWAQECLRVLKPGGHLLAFGGTRTYHRLACAIEDAGFEIRDCIAWLYGSGFPKSLDVSRAIDAQAGAVREVVGPARYSGRGRTSEYPKGPNGEQVWTVASEYAETAPATPDAERWQGWGTALKPAHEPIVMARKPLAGTVAATVLAHGTGALNVDGCRIEAHGRPLIESDSRASENAYGDGLNGSRAAGQTDVGRWPANVVLDPEAAAMLDEQTGELKSPAPYAPTSDRRDASMFGMGFIGHDREYGDSGGASRFFYVPKSSTAERNAGLDGERSTHPTVKPIDLMRWLVRLVTPPGGLVLDPFTGSGTTGCAAVLEGFRFLGIEREDEYAAIAEARIKWWAAQPPGVDVDAALEANAKRGKVEATGQMTIV